VYALYCHMTRLSVIRSGRSCAVQLLLFCQYLLAACKDRDREWWRSGIESRTNWSSSSETGCQ